jgi:uncharacterized coiled-coil DUF342 family protein
LAEREDLHQKLRRLERKASELEKQIHTVNAETLLWKEKRDALNLTVKRHREEAKRFRASRNGHNDEVKTSQVVSDALHRTLLEKRREIAREHRRLASLLATTSTSKSLLIGRKRDLEWKVQTSTLSPEEEMELIDTIRSVERALIVHRKASTVKDRIRGGRSEVETTTLRIKDVTLRLARSAASSQEDHAKMRETLNTLHDARERADDAHRHYIDGRQASASLHKKFTALLTRIQTVTLGLEEHRREKRQRRAQEDDAARTDATLDRLKKKRQISLTDFKALKKRGLIPEYE